MVTSYRILTNLGRSKFRVEYSDMTILSKILTFILGDYYPDTHRSYVWKKVTVDVIPDGALATYKVEKIFKSEQEATDYIKNKYQDDDLSFLVKEIDL